MLENESTISSIIFRLMRGQSPYFAPFFTPNFYLSKLVQTVMGLQTYSEK